jgi:hypothetical protein
LAVVLVWALGVAPGPASAAEPAESGIDTADEARRDGRPSVGGEIVELRTRSSKTFRGVDGGLVRRVWAEPVHFRADGEWREIQTSLVPDGADGFRNAANDFELAVSRRAGTRTLVRLARRNGTAVGWSLEGMSPGAEAEVDGPLARWRDALPGVDLEVRSLVDGVKEDLVLQSADAPREFVFPLLLARVEPRVRDGRREVAFVDAGGDVVGVIPAGYMVDSSVDPETQAGGVESFGVRYELVEHRGRQALKMVLDSDWLDDAARVYPVRVDPYYFWYQPTTSDDTYTAQSPAGDRSGHPELKVGHSALQDEPLNPGRYRRTYVHFSEIQPGFVEQVTYADLNLTVSKVEELCASRTMQAHRITSSWSGKNVTTLSSAPSHRSDADATKSFGCSGAQFFESSALLETVQGWVSGAVPNYGFMVRAAQETDFQAYREFYSREASVNSINKPYMEIAYNSRPNTPSNLSPAGTTVTSTSQQLSGYFYDRDGDTGRLFFRVVERGTGRVWSGEGNTVSSGSYSSWTVTGLQEGKATTGRRTPRIGRSTTRTG